MTPTVTIAIMLAVTLGAALYVAWPLLFGSVKPEEYLAVEGAEQANQRRQAQRHSDYEDERPHRRAGTAASRVDLDIEEEIEAFRRKAKETGARVALTCPSCGRPVRDPDAAFCSKCGAAINKPSAQNKKRDR